MNAAKALAALVLSGLFLTLIGGLSDAPVYTLLQPDQALVRLAFSHYGRPVSECHRLSQAELNALAPNMRKPVDCPRRRLPLVVEFHLDERQVYQQTIAPTGLWGDGEATVYARFAIPAGRHRLSIRMRDSARHEGYDYQLQRQLDIAPLRNLVIGFDPGLKQFVIH